ncbi:uncharacterized protein N7482_006272 [Penicillium canariense]|uniref:Uncharacterized protein n=1 Tax=Penicillium canariense TaxID=189055 RepID=A0A9W9I5P7_9EURO|nr:uncharacterized protein N7482_006272 [Penicillium canariense]KAJ5167491.1 hypothetical protein N7482_006272 [Penicillium canariense]
MTRMGSKAPVRDACLKTLSKAKNAVRSSVTAAKDPRPGDRFSVKGEVVRGTRLCATPFGIGFPEWDEWDESGRERVQDRGWQGRLRDRGVQYLGTSATVAGEPP